MARRTDPLKKLAEPFWKTIDAMPWTPAERETLLERLFDRWRERRYAQLRQAGVVDQDRALLADVFVDLECSASGGEERRTHETPDRIAARLLAERFDEGPRREPSLEVPIARWQGLVLVGGPGQGKSTVGQLVTQSHATVVLATAQPRFVAPGPLARSLRDDASVLSRRGLLPGRKLRVPLVVELPRFAAWHAHHPGYEGADALRAWLARELLGDETVGERVRLLLDRAPCVLLLDGLDEVPAVDGRARIQSALRGFYAQHRDADAWVLVTTRPQGYHGEFDELPAAGLLPLSDEVARAYTKQLVESWFPDLPTRRERLTERMEQALREEATANLMRSPLQVTIMAVLIERIGRAPNQRWELFNRYYRTLYDREIERESYASALLRDHQRRIDALHEHVALLLQARGEQAERSDALLSEDELRELVVTQLRDEDGFSEAETLRWTETILQATRERLVFLTGQQAQRVGFELRSLQEYMAANALFSGRETQLRERLQRIAAIPYWRNVLVFAIGRLWADQNALREELTHGLCEWLDTDPADLAAVHTCAGASLAVSILRDAPFGPKPAPRRALTARALHLLDAGPSPEVSRMVDVFSTLGDNESTDALFEAIEARLGDDVPEEQRLAAWYTLTMPLWGRDARAETMAQRHWPEGVAERQAVARLMVGLLGEAPPLLRELLEQDPAVSHTVVAEVYSLRTHKAAVRGAQKLLEAAGLELPPIAPGLVSDEFPHPLMYGLVPRIDDARFVDTAVLAGEALPVTLALDALESPYYPDARLVRVLARVLEHPATHWEVRRAARAALRRVLRRRHSRLDTPAVWEELGLPRPGPVASSPSSSPAARASNACVFARIELSKLRAFDAPPPLEPRAVEAGQWLIFLGENGCGKTTLLRALAACLAHPDDARAIPGHLEDDLRRDPGDVGRCAVTLADGRRFACTVSGTAKGEHLEPEGDAPRPWVVAYGCRRGSAFGGDDREVALRRFGELDNLFDRPRGLVHVETWLKERQRLARVSRNGASYRARDVFDAARSALSSVLLGVTSIDVEDRVYLLFDGGRRLPLAVLSDGYLTTMGWVCDMMARWIARCEREGDPIDGHFPKTMEGVALVDEIDLHLHPRWQERIIGLVRERFPRMTFVATTHNPMTLLGARDGEVFVLGEHEGAEGIRAVQRDIPRGARVDQLMTGQWFNRPSGIVHEGTREAMRDYERMILQGVPENDPRRRQRAEELRQSLGGFDDLSLERMAREIAVELLSHEVPEPTAEVRARVRESVMKRLREKGRGQRSP